MKIEALSADQEKYLQSARALALDTMPYMASILFAFRPVSAPGLGTWACDPQMRLYIDFDAAQRNGIEHSAQAMLHEAMHIFAQDHLLAGEVGAGDSAHEHKLLNVSSDAANNDDLRDAGCTIFADNNPYGHVLPASIGCIDHQTAHSYYRALKQKAPTPPPQPQQGGGDPGQGGGGQDAGDGASDPYAGCGSASGNPWSGELGDGDMAGQASPASGSERERIIISTSVAIKEHSEKSRGSVPGDMVDRAERNLQPPQVPWQKVLGRAVRFATRTRSGSTHETYQRRNSRRHDARILTQNGKGKRIVIPSPVTVIPSIVAVRDTSGSMSKKDLAMVTNEVEGIAKRLSCRGEDLRVMDFDARSRGIVKYGSARDLDEVKGRGGTDMAGAIVEATTLTPRPSAVVVLTDGETEWPGQPENRVPVVAAIICKSDRAASLLAQVPDWITAVTADVDKP